MRVSARIALWGRGTGSCRPPLFFLTSSESPLNDHLGQYLVFRRPRQKSLYSLLPLLVKMELKTVTISSKGQIALPKDIREMKGFSNGSKIALFMRDDKKVFLLPLSDDETFLRSLQDATRPIRRRTPEERDADAREFVAKIKSDTARQS